MYLSMFKNVKYIFKYASICKICTKLLIAIILSQTAMKIYLIAMKNPVATTLRKILHSLVRQVRLGLHLRLGLWVMYLGPRQVRLSLRLRLGLWVMCLSLQQMRLGVRLLQV